MNACQLLATSLYSYTFDELLAAILTNARLHFMWGYVRSPAEDLRRGFRHLSTVCSVMAYNRSLRCHDNRVKKVLHCLHLLTQLAQNVENRIFEGLNFRKISRGGMSPEPPPHCISIQISKTLERLRLVFTANSKRQSPVYISSK